jgi:hypothetical protein
MPYRTAVPGNLSKREAVVGRRDIGVKLSETKTSRILTTDSNEKQTRERL